MSLAKSNDTEKLEDYAVDVGRLKQVHQELTAKRSQIEALVAEEQNLGPVETLSAGAKERLMTQVVKLLEEWEREKDEDVIVPTGSVAFNKLAREHFDLQQRILNAEDEQVEEATEHPFDRPLR